MPEVMFGSTGVTTAGLRLRFDSPLRTFSANQLHEVVPVLAAAETAARSGCWVAVMLCYEAAPAFDGSLKTHRPSSLPLAWAAVFDKPLEPATSPNVAAELGSDGNDPGSWKSPVSRSEYAAAVARIHDLIARGYTYQVNYTLPLESHFNGDPRVWYDTLCSAQGADYCAYFDLGTHQLLSISPELFFDRRGDSIKTKPMKGTIKRGRSIVEDEQRALQLAESPKDRAENVMIVDLLRNDLGKISIPGSVQVSKLFEIERYETLWQMTSTVESTLRGNVGLVDVMTALFPCGSITGAPKVRTMEIIRELERFPRGVYTGTVGFIRPGGDCVFNVAIRTVLLDSITGTATFGVGGGITIDSTAEREYEECLLKGSFLYNAAPPFQLFESILLEDGEFFLLARHMDRLKASAKYFDFQLSEPEALRTLEHVVTSGLIGRWKIRLLLSKSGQIEIETIQLHPTRPEPLRVRLALQPVDSNDKFLFHKTTHRSVYDRAVTQRADCDDVVFWNERGEVTESSVANLVVAMNGELFTPPQDSGLLAGTFRAELLAQGRIRERVITVPEMRAATRVFLVNSVRQWMPAALID
jgi:para-aminobenzoate synthetase / 4-amino-4-deoxychorismate lyase